MDHLALCREVTRSIQTIWEREAPDRTPYAVRLAQLASVIANQNSGRQGAGLTGGVQQEQLFKDMLLGADPRFTEESANSIADADYYFNDYPLSHKTIGYTGTGDLALAWSKNPPGGLVRDEFRASMVIMSFRRRSAGKWNGLPAGAFVIPLNYLREHIRFSSNNKTDSLISSDQVVGAMRYALAEGTASVLKYQHDFGAGVRVSLWRSGAGPKIPPM